MIKEIIESNLPNYATLSSATITLNDMGDRTISTQMKILGSIVPSFSYNGEAWAVTYNGEKFILTVRDPEASKSIDGSSSTISLNFESEFCYELKRYLFFEAASTYAGTIIADKYKASLKLSISDFVTNFNQVLSYYFGAGVFSIRLAQGVSFSSTPALFDIDHIYIWDVLQKIYEIYNVRWGMSFSVVGGVTQYVITIGEAVSALDHVFEYGYAGGLTKCERQIQESNIRNILLGRGGDKNLPMYYFKDVPEGSPYTPDPDRCPELNNENAPINITQLHGKAFRDYIQGWNYGKNYVNARPEPLNPSDAWSQGYTDATTGAKFNPVEYVKDQDSIDKYGELWSGLDDNEDIYPSIQGVKMPSPDYSDANAVVAVEQVTNDDIEEAVAKSVVITDLPAAVQATCTGVWRKKEPAIPLAYMYCEVWSREFTVPEGQTANITYDTAIYVSDLVTWNQNGLTGVKEMDKIIHTQYNPIIHTSTDAVNPSYFMLQHAGTGYYYSDGEGHPIHNPSAIPAGSYRLIVHVGFTPTFPDGEQPHITFTSEISNIQITSAAISVWKPSFDIWIKNIWGTTKGQSESYSAYTSRVWNPILGDLSEGTKQISFVDGALSASSDWDFKILGVEYNTDNTKIYEDASHNTHKAEWKLTLEKSQAEKETDNKFIPRENTNASAGDHIMVLGIQLPQVLVEAAEERLDLWKTEQLNSTKDIEPTWAITLDKVRINTLEGDETVLLSSLVDAGVKIQLRDIRFSSGIKELYIQSLEKTWNDETVMNPEINVVLTDKVIPVSNPVSKIKAEVKTIQSQYVAIQDVEAAVRRVGSLQFLNKTGSEDTSMSPTKFSNVVQSSDFRQGDIGGMGWGFYKDKQGNSIFEADTIIARNNLITNEIISNIATYVGGLQIYSAASIICTNIVEDVSGYSCYFDNKLGSLANLFQERDIAYSHTFDSNNSTISFYKRKVIEVGLDYVKLSKTNFAEGSSVPAIGDTIIHYGNFNDSNRQFVIVRDVVNGGYERMISNLNGYNAGTEYYYAGAVLSGSEVQKRWFVGDTSNYAKYEKVGDSYALTIKGNVFVGDTDISSWAYLAESLGSKNGGLVLANKLAVYNGTDAQATVQGGINGVYIDSNSIAAWFGGDMKDRAISQDLDAASILFRFGGSGYVAKNNLSWDENGVVTLNPDQIYVSSGLKMSEVNQIANIIGLKPVDNISTAFIKEGRPFLVENNITATGIVRGDAGVFSGGIADLGEYGSSGFNDIEYIGSGNIVTNVDKNVSSLKVFKSFSVYSDTEIDTIISTEVTNRNTAITDAINLLDVEPVGGAGEYISAISEANGKISATASNMPTLLSQFTDDLGSNPLHTHSQYMLASASGAANGVAPLDINKKIPAAYLYDYFFGQVLYGGGLGANALATLTSLGKSKLGITNSTITLTNNNTAITGYVANEGIYYIVTSAQTFAGISFEVGDWCISNGSAWTKVDNTDAVASVVGLTGTIQKESLLNALNVADGAQVNVLEGVKLNGTPLSPTPTSKIVNVNACTSITVPTGLSVAALTTGGLIAISLAANYAIPTTANITQIGTNKNNINTLQGYFTNGSAKTALKLTTAVAINGTTFDGSAAITTSKWGTARYVGIVNSDGTGTAVTVSIDGSGNVNLKLPASIKAALDGNAATANKVNHILTRGAYLTGNNFDGSANTTWSVDATSANTASKVVARDINGDFAARVISGQRIYGDAGVFSGGIGDLSEYSSGGYNDILPYPNETGNAVTSISDNGGSTLYYHLGSFSLSGHNHSTLYQPLDADLTAIAGLAGTSGFLKKTAANTWALDTNTYLTGNQKITLSGIITGSGTTSIATSIADAALSIAKTSGLQTALNAKMATSAYPDLVAIEALSGTSGFLKKTAANTWSLDTNVYLTGITKTQVEAVLTGAITSHTHNYQAPLTGTGFVKSAAGVISYDTNTYLTTHQTIYGLTIQKNGDTIATYTPNSASKTINISDVASASTLATHIANKSNPHAVTKAQVGLGSVENAAASTLYVPLTRTVAGLALSGNIATASLRSALGLGSAAYTPSSNYATSGHTHHAGELGVTPASYKVSSVSAGIAPYIDSIGTNIFAGANSSELKVERSTNDGATWADVTSSEAANIKNVFSGCVDGYLYVSANAHGVVGDKLRITFNPYSSSRYCQLAFLYLYFSTNGCSCTCDIEKNLYTDQNSWSSFSTGAPIAGWAGPNVIGMGPTTFGQGDSRNNGYGIRLTFRINGVSTEYDSRGSIYSIRGYTANKAWGDGRGNSIAKYGTPYRYLNADRAVQFDNSVSATAFTEGGTALASKYLGLHATADKVVINNSFTGTYPLTVNVNGVLYSHNNITYNGTTGTLTAAIFAGALSGNATTATTATNLSRSIIAGNGLSGGGVMTADRTITLGTPSDITATSTNSVTSTSHTHEIVMGTGSGLDADKLDSMHAVDFVNVASTQTITGAKTFSNGVVFNENIVLANTKGFYSKNTTGEILQLLMVNSNNDTTLGYGARVRGHKTVLQGYVMQAVVGSGVSAFDISALGDMSMYKSVSIADSLNVGGIIQGVGGVFAGGIADLGGGEYAIPAASASSIGGIKIGYTNNAKNYKVNLDASGNAYVNVPWVNTVYSGGDFINIDGTTIKNAGTWYLAESTQNGYVTVVGGVNPSGYDIPIHGLGSAAYTNISAYAAASHGHGNITNGGKIGSTAALPIITGTGGLLQAGSFGTAAGTFCQGNDSRLSDSRPASDVYSWAKQSVKPSYNFSEIGNTSSVAVESDWITPTLTKGTHGTSYGAVRYRKVGSNVQIDGSFTITWDGSSQLQLFELPSGHNPTHNMTGWLYNNSNGIWRYVIGTDGWVSLINIKKITDGSNITASTLCIFDSFTFPQN